MIMLAKLPAALEPPEVELYLDDDLFVKQLWLKKAGFAVAQHSHEHDHVTMLAKGEVDVWLDGKLLGRFAAPAPIPVKAGTKHTFIAAVDDCVLYCIHALHGKDYPGIREEHTV